jgi:hypothetical protein
MITTANSSFTVDAAKALDQALSHVSLPTAQGTGLSTGSGDSSGMGNGFGSFTGSGNQLSGYFYDLKQTPDKKPTGMTSDKLRHLLANFVAQGWDDSLLDSYY